MALNNLSAYRRSLVIMKRTANRLFKHSTNGGQASPSMGSKRSSYQQMHSSPASAPHTYYDKTTASRPSPISTASNTHRGSLPDINAPFSPTLSSGSRTPNP